MFVFFLPPLQLVIAEWLIQVPCFYLRSDAFTSTPSRSLWRFLLRPKKCFDRGFLTKWWWLNNLLCLCYSLFYLMSHYIINAGYIMHFYLHFFISKRGCVLWLISFSSTRFYLPLQHHFLYSKSAARVAPCNSILGALPDPIWLKDWIQPFNSHRSLSGYWSHPYGYLLLFSALFCSFLIRSLNQNPGLLLP